MAPRSLVAAAHKVCAAYGYTGHDNCAPVRLLAGSDVTVASAAARYNPVFYWLVGKPASYFTGATSLYVMRVVSALLCSLFLAAAPYCLSLWSRSRWPLTSMFVALTPMVAYSTAVAAPNGVEMAAALTVWSALLGLALPDT